MNILVTGSAGFVGSHLVAALKDAGHFVTGIDKNTETHSDVFIHHDLCHKYLGAIKPQEICIHLACDVGGFLHNAGCEELKEKENQVFISVQDLCKAAGCSRIIFTSSINVFEAEGEYNHGPLNGISQRTYYAQSKAELERAIEKTFAEFVIIRPTNIFGVKQKKTHTRIGESHVIPDMIHKLKNDPVLEILGDGTQVRNFIPVENVVRFISAVLIEPKKGWFNLRSNIHITITDLAYDLMEFLKIKKEIVYSPEYLCYEPRRIELFDIAVINSIKWNPVVPEACLVSECFV